MIGDDRKLIRTGYAVVAVVFGGFGLWSALAPIDSAAVAPGVVTVESSRKVIKHLEGGIVRRVHVTEGQWVREGDLLLELEGRQFRSELDSIRVQQATLEAARGRLIAERDGRADPDFGGPAALPGGDERLDDARQAQRELFTARRKAHDGEISMLRQTVGQLRAQIDGLAAVAAAKRKLIASFEIEIKDLRELLAEGFADRQKLREYERNVAALAGEVAELQATSAAAAARQAEAELKILQVDRDFRASVIAELGEVQVKLADASERLNTSVDRVDRAVIRSPVSGRILKLNVHTEGGVVAPGEPLMEVVPDHDELVVDGRVSPLDVDRVRAGLAATVRFTALPRDRQSRLQGTVTSLSADRLVDERSGVAYYTARVAIRGAEAPDISKLDLQPGMPAEVMINTGSRTLLAYLWDPLGDAVDRSFRED